MENSIREDLISEISDTFKEMHGVRPRHYRYSDMTLVELYTASVQIHKAAHEQYMAEKEFEEHMDALNLEEERLSVMYADPAPFPYDEMVA